MGTDWAGLTREMERLLHLRTYPVAYKKLDKATQLDGIPRVRRFSRTFTFCQVPTMVRRGGLTIGITRENLGERCARLNGLAATTEEAKARDAANFSRTWYATEEIARQQMEDYPLIPPGEALVLAPLVAEKFEPDVILIYGNPAQLMLLMCGLQFKRHQRFQSFSLGKEPVPMVWLNVTPAASPPWRYPASVSGVLARSPRTSWYWHYHPPRWSERLTDCKVSGNGD
jgi:uncharacterized protein (DUF169 family)